MAKPKKAAAKKPRKKRDTGLATAEAIDSARTDTGLGFNNPKKLKAARAGVVEAGRTLRANKAKRAEFRAQPKRGKNAPSPAARKKMEKELGAMKEAGKAARATRKASGMGSDG